MTGNNSIGELATTANFAAISPSICAGYAYRLKIWIRNVIDLHSHLLPGIDDGAADLSVSIAMARASVANGVRVMACTPHILQGVWNNSGPQIRQATQALQAAIDAEGIPLKLITGADVHIERDIVSGLHSGRVLSLADSRYVLIELPHHVAPARIEDCFFGLFSAGYVPILTHPERLSWIGSRYVSIERLVKSGVWMQITAGSLLGSFGRSARYWSEKMLDQGMIHIIATDAHNLHDRRPVLAEGRDAASRLVGKEEAQNLVVARPYGIIANKPATILPGPALSDASSKADYAERRSSQHNPVWSAVVGRRTVDDAGSYCLPERVRRIFQWP